MDHSEFQNNMLDILNAVNNDEMPILDSQEHMRALKECVDPEYLKGFKVYTMASGEIVCDILINQYVTEKGLKFIDNPSSDKAENPTIAQPDNKKPYYKLKSFWATIVTIITMIVSVFSPDIREFLVGIFQNFIGR